MVLLSSANSEFPNAFRSYKPRFMKVFGCICLSKSRKILVVKGRDTQIWSLPKGHVEGRETDHECALRELFEETGITPKTNYASYKKLTAGGYFVYVFDDEPMPIPLHTNEIQEARWMSFEELADLNCNVDLSTFGRRLKHPSIHIDRLLGDAAGLAY
jgi:8-oxo-dGTP pyrophosphatase MutT (NUDIX family)